MSHTFVLAAVLALTGSAAAAEEGPAAPPVPSAPAAAPRHQNRITPEAKAMFERMDRLLYSPVKAGIKDLSGTVVMKMDMGGGGGGGRGGMPSMDMKFSVAFTAPATVKVEMTEAAGFMRQAGEGMTKGMQAMMRHTLGIYRPADDEEYDAETREENGKQVLVLTSYEKAAPVSTTVFTLDDKDLIESGAHTSKVPGPTGKVAESKATTRYTWARSGDLYMVEKIAMTSSEAPAPFEYVLAYADVSGAKVAVAWEMRMKGMPAPMAYRFTDLTVNGKAVTVPAASSAPGPVPPDGAEAGAKRADEKGEDEKDEEEEGEDMK